MTIDELLTYYEEMAENSKLLSPERSIAFETWDKLMYMVSRCEGMAQMEAIINEQRMKIEHLEDINSAQHNMIEALAERNEWLVLENHGMAEMIVGENE